MTNRDVVVTLATIIAIAAGGCARHTDPPPTPRTEATVLPGAGNLDGAYTLHADGTRQTLNGRPQVGGVPSTTAWQITPCGATCARVRSSLGWTTDLHLAGGRWTATRTLDIDCGHGPSTITYSLDAGSLTGTLTNTTRCGATPSVVIEPARLTRN